MVPGPYDRENELQVEESYWAAVDAVQAGFAQHGDNLAKIETHVAVQVLDQSPPFPSRASDIYGNEPPARLQDPPHLADTLLACVPRHVVEHQ